MITTMSYVPVTHQSHCSPRGLQAAAPNRSLAPSPFVDLTTRTLASSGCRASCSDVTTENHKRFCSALSCCRTASECCAHGILLDSKCRSYKARILEAAVRTCRETKNLYDHDHCRFQGGEFHDAFAYLLFFDKFALGSGTFFEMGAEDGVSGSTSCARPWHQERGGCRRHGNELTVIRAVSRVLQTFTRRPLVGTVFSSSHSRWVSKAL